SDGGFAGTGDVHAESGRVIVDVHLHVAQQGAGGVRLYHHVERVGVARNGSVGEGEGKPGSPGGRRRQQGEGDQQQGEDGLHGSQWQEKLKGGDRLRDRLRTWSTQLSATRPRP